MYGFRTAVSSLPSCSQSVEFRACSLFGLQAEGNESVADWNHTKTTLATVAFSIGYALSVIYVALFIVLYTYRNAAQRLLRDGFI
jgi:hypothetical protein